MNTRHVTALLYFLSYYSKQLLLAQKSLTKYAVNSRNQIIFALFYDLNTFIEEKKIFATLTETFRTSLYNRDSFSGCTLLPQSKVTIQWDQGYFDFNASVRFRYSWRNEQIDEKSKIKLENLKKSSIPNRCKYFLIASITLSFPTQRTETINIY